MSLLACGDPKEEVREDGKKGIVPPEDDPTADYPQFTAVLKYIFIRVSSLRLFCSSPVTVLEFLHMNSSSMQFLALCIYW